MTLGLARLLVRRSAWLANSCLVIDRSIGCLLVSAISLVSSLIGSMVVTVLVRLTSGCSMLVRPMARAHDSIRIALFSMCVRLCSRGLATARCDTYNMAPNPLFFSSRTQARPAVDGAPYLAEEWTASVE